MFTALLFYILFAEITFLCLKHYLINNRLWKKYTTAWCAAVSGGVAIVELVAILFLNAIRGI